MFLRFNSIEKFGRRNLPPIESYNSDHYCGYDSNFEKKYRKFLAVLPSMSACVKNATLNIFSKPKNLYSVNDKPFLNSIADTHHIY